MWILRLTLLLAISGSCLGQTTTIYYDIGSQIELDGTAVLSSTDTERKICYDGTDLYYTSGTQIIRQSDNTVVVDTEGPDIDSISCHCNILVYAYQESGSTFVVYYDTDDSGISIDFDLSSASRVAVEISPDNGLIIVGAFNVWMYDYAPLLTSGRSFSFNVGQLDNFPGCIASYQSGSDLLVYVTYEVETNVQAIEIPDSAASGDEVGVTDRDVKRSDNFDTRVACVDIADDTIYFLTRLTSDANWELNSYTITNWLTGSEEYSAATEEESGTDGDFSSNVNGLIVCGTDCPATCSQASCSCPTSPACGFCAGDDATCQCQDSGQDGCNYVDATQEAQCFVPDPHLDSYCIVDEPLAKRRKGGPIRVFGAALEDAVFGVSRLAQTGRWNTDTLPISTSFADTDGPVWYNGFEADVPSSARGRRFGIYVADIDPADVNSNPESIPCIATENSGFFNTFYTYTRSLGDSVTLEATFTANLVQFTSNLRWDFIGFDANDDPLNEDPIPECNGALTCTLNSLTAEDQGVYQVYRPRRRRRTWHPIFYLFVRECADGSFGSTCSGTCPACVHGVCDELSGLCTCKAGWTDTLCDTACNAGQIGQECDADCSDILADRTDCSGLSFCVPGKVGCTCYSGFQPPECTETCEMGSCGPNCASACDGGAADCDPRTCIAV